MKEKYNIGEVAEIFKVPKSTLRYWDSESLIRMDRNHINDYREYTLKQIVDISDIAFYRSINVPIAKLKKMFEINIEEFDDILNETQKDLDTQIEQLKEKKKIIVARRDNIRELTMLQSAPYTKSRPDMDRIIDFEMSHFYEQNPYDFAIFISPEDNYGVHYGSILLDDSQNDNAIWECSNSSDKFLQCLLKISVDNPEQNNLKEHLGYIEKSGHKSGVIVGRYLISGIETIRYEYYKIWIEIIE